MPFSITNLFSYQILLLLFINMINSSSTSIIKRNTYRKFITSNLYHKQYHYINDTFYCLEIPIKPSRIGIHTYLTVHEYKTKEDAKLVYIQASLHGKLMQSSFANIYIPFLLLT